MKGPKALVILGGSIDDYSFYESIVNQADFIVCADSGARHMRNFNKLPNILVGDFDSISDEDFNFYSRRGVEIRRFPREKDITDGEIAVDVAIEKGSRDMTIIGAIGVRFDHTIGNVMMLKKALGKGIDAKIIDEHNEIMLINHSVTVPKTPGTKLSLVPFSDVVEGITTTGLYYPLNNAKSGQGGQVPVSILENGHRNLSPLSTFLSNEFVTETATISITNGLLLVIKSTD